MRRLLVLTLLAAVAAAPAVAQVCTPTVLDSVTVPGTPTQPALYGSTAWIAAGAAGLVPVDVSNPAALMPAGAVGTPGEAHDVIADFFSGVLVVADGSAGVSAFVASGTGLTLTDSTALGEPATVLARSGSSYLAGGSGGTLYTVSVGASVVVEGSVDVGSEVLDVTSVGQRAFVAAGSSGLAIVSLTDRTQPALVATVDLGGAVRSIAGSSKNLYAGVDGHGLVALQSDADVVTQIGTVATLATPSALLATTNRVFAVIPGHGILIFDTSFGIPLQVGELSLPGAAGLELAGSVLYVGLDSGGFATVDISPCASSGVSPSTLYIPAAAHAEGNVGTYWVTDVAVANLSAGNATINIGYLVKNRANPNPVNVSYVLQSGQQLLLEDVLNSVFGLNDGNGAVRVIVSHPNVRVTSRTYNAAGASGTYGQFIAAVDERDALGSGVSGVLPQLAENGAFRTNIGLLNVTGIDTEATVDMYRHTGAYLGSHAVALRPYEMRQVDRILSGAGTVDSGYAVVRVTGEGGEVLAYGSVVDNASGDPIYVPVQALVPGTPFGG